MKTILFQGDSITDARRDYNNDNFSGHGYATMVKGELGAEFPGKYVFLNRGISGNRISDVYARIKCDILNLKPDYMSLLVGVNDTWHELDRQNGVPANKYEKLYCMLLDEIYEQLPNIKIILLEPYVLHGSATDSTEEQPGYFDRFSADVYEHAKAAAKVAEKYKLPFIRLQKVFDDALSKAPSTYWTIDGVHPTAMGHELIKREWIKVFNTIK